MHIHVSEKNKNARETPNFPPKSQMRKRFVHIKSYPSSSSVPYHTKNERNVTTEKKHVSEKQYEISKIKRGIRREI
jgi:hypothetical protein